MIATLTMVICFDVNKNGNHQTNLAKKSTQNTVHRVGQKGKSNKRHKDACTYSPNDNACQRGIEEQAWNQECRCANGTKILTQIKRPIKCACILDDYDKALAPGGREIEATVRNTFGKILILDLKGVDKIITSYIGLTYRWEDERITTTFPNNKSKLFITSTHPEDKSFPIWAPNRSLRNGKILDVEWKLSFLNSFLTDRTTVVGHFSGKMRSFCDLDFKNLPFDTNWCDFRITSKLSGELREVLDQTTMTNAYFAHNFVSDFVIHITLIGSTINDTDTITNDFGFQTEIKQRISSYLI